MSPSSTRHEGQERAERQDETETNPCSGCHRAASIPEEYANADANYSQEQAGDEWQLNQCKRSPAEM
jgi:hypothetical protein